MDDLNFIHVLGDRIQQLEHGVELTTQHEFPSKTLICFLDELGGFFYGFAYKNGSNLRVVTWCQNGRANKTVPRGKFVIAFRGERTERNFRDPFEQADFNLEWFGDDARRNAEEELRALIQKEDRLNEIVAGMAGLTLQELDQVIAKIRELQR